MRNYQIWGFSYINKNTDKSNVLTGNNKECEEEVEIPCFDGIAYFKACGKYYTMTYPRINTLNSYQMDRIYDYCGYYPESGEYGVIAGALGCCIECDEKTFRNLSMEYPLKKKDKDLAHSLE
jgi:hypothetical protein